MTVTAAVLAVPSAAQAAPDPAGPPAAPRTFVGMPQVASPRFKAPGPLPSKAGRVPLLSTLTTAAAEQPNLVGLRALVVAVDADDFGLATWKATLDRVGAAYDVLLSRTTPLTAASLVRPDGAGRYNAILLTNASLLYNDNGTFVSGFDGDEWNTLWTYERTHAVRQATLYASHGTWPEDYCLRPVSEGGVGDTPLVARFTASGAGVFDYLKAAAPIPIIQSYVYRDSIATGCAGAPVLTSGTSVLGVRSTSTDGRERMAFTFTSNVNLLQSDLLVYGLFRWASRGLFLGQQRHFLNVDIDDWFNSSDHYFPDGHIESDPGFQLTGHDAYNLDQRQTAIRLQYPLANTFTFNLAYNGGDANLSAGSTCSPNGGIAQLTATSRCLRNRFRWLNHTLTHPEMNFTSYATSHTEIAQNRTVATTLGLSQPNTVLKTGEYSGLGVYNPNPDDDVNPPTDFGLGASNPNLLAAARDLGVRHLHGNMSFPSHVPGCFNCAKVHPMESTITVVPDWPTNIAYHTTTPAEQTAFYNSLYGPGGKIPFFDHNLTYAEMLSFETDIALRHLASGSIYAHTFHISNVRDYGSGRTLVTDWVLNLVGKYNTYYRVPVLNPAWPALAQYTTGRNAHFAGLPGVDAVYDRTTNRVTMTSPAAAQVTLTGARAPGYTAYGTDVSAQIPLSAGVPTTFPR
jgi:hypothetical protein